MLRTPRRRKSGLRRAALTVTAFVASVLCLALIAGGVLFARLSQGPIALGIGPQIMAALNQQVGHGYTFALSGASIEATEHGPALTLTELSVKDAAAHPVVTAPKAAISIDPADLLLGKISPNRLEIRDIDLRLVVRPDGQVAVSAGTDEAAFPLMVAFSGVPHDTAAGPGGSGGRGGGEPASTASSGPEPANAAVRALSAVLRSLVDATTSPDSALGPLERIGITGRLVLDDQTHGTHRVFNNTELSFDRSADGAAMLTVAADGQTGRWSLASRAARASGAAKTLTVEVHNISLDEITLAGGLHGVGFDFDMPVSASAAFQLDGSGALKLAQGRFAFGEGYFKLDDPDHEPLLIDSIAGGFRLADDGRTIAIEPTVLHAGESVFTLQGRVAAPEAAGQPWVVNTEASGTFGTERPGEKPIKIAHAGMAFRILPGERRLLVDNIEVSGPEVAYQMTADVHAEGQGFRLKSTNTVGRMPAQALVRLWPSFIAAPVRAWFLANLRGGWVDSGTATVNLTDADLALMRAQRSVPDDHVRVDYSVSDLALTILPGLPPLANLAGTGSVTGHTANFDASRGDMEVSPGHRLTLNDGTFHVPDSDPKPTPAVINAHVTGTIDSAADILSRDALKPYANLPIDSSAVKGQVDSHLVIALLLGDHVPPDETKVSATATATNFAADKVIGKEGFVDATLNLTADKGGFHAKGDGRLFGAPATIDLKKPAGGGPSEAVITMSIDDAARAKAGFSFGRGLTGSVGARVTTSLTPGEKSKAGLELDFSKAAMDGLVPGFSKPAGRPAKATMTVLPRDNGTSLDSIVFEGGGASVRGSAELNGDGGFSSAKLSQVKLSSGDDLKLEATQTADGLKLVGHGANVDARPFLKWLGTSGPGGAPEKSEPAKNVDLELHASVMTGQNNQVLTGADFRFSRRGGQLKRLQLTGHIERQPISVTTNGENGTPHFVVTSSDAGASLAFLDLYKRMVGGRLDANLVMNGERLDGFATIHDFTLREDPAIRKLATEGLAGQNRIEGNGNRAQIDPSSVPFTKLEARFSKLGNQVTVRDGAFFGPEVGATVDGTLDFAHDRVNLSGTFVPIYGVNNLFSQIPLFGPILGGGAREGLFGLNYRIAGSASAPVLSVDPLSAIAPGFLRKVFGAIESAAEGQAEPRHPGPREAGGGADPQDHAPLPLPSAPPPPDPE